MTNQKSAPAGAKSVQSKASRPVKPSAAHLALSRELGEAEADVAAGDRGISVGALGRQLRR